jgi:hypothetical protein
MRTLLVAVVLAIGSAAHAAPCISATSPSTEDAMVVQRALARAFPVTPRTCVDASVVSLELDDTHDDVTLTGTVRIVVSDDQGRMTVVVSGNATLHLSRRDYRRSMRTYRRDALEEAIGGLVPRLRSHVTPSRAIPTS